MDLEKRPAELSRPGLVGILYVFQRRESRVTKKHALKNVEWKCSSAFFSL